MIDIENLQDDLELCGTKIEGYLEELRDNEKQKEYLLAKLYEWKEHKQYLEIKLGWCRLEA